MVKELIMTNKIIVNNMNIMLADSYALYLKTQNYHWNVTGHQFKILHILFEEQYTDLAEAVDELAERIRTFGDKVTASFSAFDNLATIADGSENSSADKMVLELEKDNLSLAKAMKETIKICQEHGDEATADILIKRVEVHEKNAWMLKSSLN